MNPCPCGHLNNPPHECVCTPGQITKYQRKISGPLLDRIDLFIEVPPVEIRKIDEEHRETDEAEAIRQRVGMARKVQSERFSAKGSAASGGKNEKMLTNSEMGLREIKKYCPLDEETKKLLRQAYEKYAMSVRSYYRTIKIARTIADLAGSQNIEAPHLLEALQYRAKTEV